MERISWTLPGEDVKMLAPSTPSRLHAMATISKRKAAREITIMLVTLLAIAGCQPHRPDFMTRVRQDCAAGDRWACDLLDGLAHPKPDRASARGG